MKLPRFAVLLLGIIAWSSLHAAPDGRLAGYWVTPPGAAGQVAFTFSIFGKWTIVSPHLPGVPDGRFRYTVESTGDSGTLTMDEPPEKQAGAPKVIRYTLQSGELTIEFAGPEQPVRILLVKGVPPSTRPAETATAPKPAPKPAKPAAPAVPGPTLIGSWATEPGAEKKLKMTFSRSPVADIRANQLWIKGSDNPVTSSNADYTGVFANGRGRLTKTKADYEGSPIPMVLDFAFEGEALVITVDDGTFAGQYRLIRQGK